MVDDEQHTDDQRAEQPGVDADDERAEEGHQPQGDLGLALLPYMVELGEVRHLAHGDDDDGGHHGFGHVAQQRREEEHDHEHEQRRDDAGEARARACDGVDGLRLGLGLGLG